MTWVAEPAAKGLFAKAETYVIGEQALSQQVMMFAAHVALSRGLVRRHDGYGTLADVESFLRDFGSAAYFFAAPRIGKHAAHIHPAAYSWLPLTGDIIPEPYYVLSVVTGTPTARDYEERRISSDQNLEMLTQTGLPQLQLSVSHRETLLTMVTPSSWE